MGKSHKKNHKKNKKQSENDPQIQDEQQDPIDTEEIGLNEHESHPDKRHIEEHDSDNEDKPKRKKKKKPIIPVDTDDKKGKKSIRQMKKERHAQRIVEKQNESKDQLKSQCLQYLSQWKHDKQNWKFMKVKQGWLFRNKFSSSLLPETSWPVFLEYFESAQGNIKKMLLEDANKIIKQMDEYTESQNNKDNKSEDDNKEQTEKQPIDKPDEVAYKRARDIIQCLHE